MDDRQTLRAILRMLGTLNSYAWYTCSCAVSPHSEEDTPAP